MPSMTTKPKGRATQATVAANVPMKKTPAIRGAKLLSWKTTLVQSLGRELHALHIQHQERAFMATTHGLNYRAVACESAALH